MVMIRTQVYVSSEQQQKLRRIAARRGCTEAEVVRVAIERLPEYDDLITRRLAEAGILASEPDDDDLLSEDEAERLERELDKWAERHGPLGLSQAVLDAAISRDRLVARVCRSLGYVEYAEELFCEY
jgi:hypothetical protein